jgi:hypothetical protein
MTDYQYRVVYRLKQEHWVHRDDDKWRVWHSATNPSGRPYQNAGAVKTIVTSKTNKSDRYEYKAQRFPLTQEWEDM